MSQDDGQIDLIPQSAIRVETVLSRFPVHRLVKRGGITIDIRESTPEGEIKTKWEVSYNSKYGQPGPLAYKIDSLIINRRIDESPRPIPKIIKLGSLNEICRELGLSEGKAIGDVKKALLQNASAFITAKRSFEGSDGVKRTAEIADTRYGVVFTGEQFPNGSKADAVYILLHDAYHDVLNAAPTRPLDYDYLRELSPGTQRFYELLSFQMFGALANQRPRAKMLYSYYCTRAPQVRYFDYDHVKKQMYKLHHPHKASGYIAAVEFRATTDAEGRADWQMLYTPGSRAKAEFQQFTQPQKNFAAKPKRELADDMTVSPAAHISTRPTPPPTLPEMPADPLVTRLCGFGISETKAKHLVLSHREAVHAQLEAYPYRCLPPEQKNAAGWLISAIEQNYEVPPALLAAKRRKDDTQRTKQRRTLIEACELCNTSGFRMIKRPDGTGTAAKKCTHDAQIESRYENA